MGIPISIKHICLGTGRCPYHVRLWIWLKSRVLSATDNKLVVSVSDPCMCKRYTSLSFLMALHRYGSNTNSEQRYVKLFDRSEWCPKYWWNGGFILIIVNVKALPITVQFNTSYSCHATTPSIWGHGWLLSNHYSAWLDSNQYTVNNKISAFLSGQT